MKIRIVEDKNFENTRYFVQVRRLFFFWVNIADFLPVNVFIYNPVFKRSYNDIEEAKCGVEALKRYLAKERDRKAFKREKAVVSTTDL